MYIGYDNIKHNAQPWHLWFMHGEQCEPHARDHLKAEDMYKLVTLHRSKQAGKSTHAAELMVSVNYPYAT